VHMVFGSKAAAEQLQWLQWRCSSQLQSSTSVLRWRSTPSAHQRRPLLLRARMSSVLCMSSGQRSPICTATDCLLFACAADGDRLKQCQASYHCRTAQQPRVSLAGRLGQSASAIAAAPRSGAAVAGGGDRRRLQDQWRSPAVVPPPLRHGSRATTLAPAPLGGCPAALPLNQPP
jgi:hypothetical protein